MSFQPLRLKQMPSSVPKAANRQPQTSKLIAPEALLEARAWDASNAQSPEKQVLQLKCLPSLPLAACW